MLEKLAEMVREEGISREYCEEYEEGLEKWAQAVAAAFASALRSLPIDWQAEADRKDAKEAGE